MRITTLDDLRTLVKQERSRRGMSQSEAAGIIGHTQKWLSDFERGRTAPPADMALRLVNLLGIRLTATVPVPAEGEDADEIAFGEGAGL